MDEWGQMFNADHVTVLRLLGGILLIPLYDSVPVSDIERFPLGNIIHPTLKTARASIVGYLEANL